MSAQPDGQGPIDTARTEAFSDGVFAIAITLLVLTIDPPSPGDVDSTHSLFSLLAHSWPSYLAYVAAFLATGVTWLNHHGVFAKIAATDTGLQCWNLVLLLAVSFSPYPTSLVARYLSDSLTGPSAQTATLVFVVVSALRPLLWVVIWRYLRGHRDLLQPWVDEEHVRLEERRALVGVGTYVVAAAVAVFAPIAAIALCLAIALFYAVTAQGRHASGRAG